MIDNDLGSLRGAPFGVPVVPLVRITILGPTLGFDGGSVEPASINFSSVSASSVTPSSAHARNRPCGDSTPSSISAYSSS